MKKKGRVVCVENERKKMPGVSNRSKKKMKIVDNFIWKELILEGMLGIDSYDIFIKCSMVDFAE